MGGPCERDPLSHLRPGHRPAGLVRPQPGVEDPAAGCGRGGLTADRAAERVGGRRVASPQRARVRVERSPRDRAPHGRHERLLALTGRGDHAWNPDLPRQIEWLERHRLQLPGRPVWNRLRGPLWRDRPERRRSARARLQHGVGGHRRDRHLRELRDPGSGRGVAREAPRLATRSRSHRSPLHPHGDLGWQRAVCRRDPGLAARSLRPP